MEEYMVTQKMRKTLKDGTVKEYVYKRKPMGKHPILYKQRLHELIRNCDDKEKIDAIAKSIDEILNNNQVKQDNAENNNHDAA